MRMKPTMMNRMGTLRSLPNLDIIDDMDDTSEILDS